MKSKWTFVILFCGLLTLGTALAQPKTFPASQKPGGGSTPTPSSSPAMTYQYRLNNETAANLIHHINQLEIQEADIALTRLQTPAGLQLAQTLLSSYETNDQQVMSIPTSSEVTFYYFQPSTFEIATASQLARVWDENYDAAYYQVQEEVHQRALADLQLALGWSTNMDPDVVTQLNSTIALVQSNSTLITTAQNGGSSSSPGPIPSTSPSAGPSVSPSNSPSPSPSASSSPMLPTTTASVSPNP